MSNLMIETSKILQLSIIVPMYNAESYISRCLDSILAQDLVKYNYEIIIVDDGSTDSSLKICKQYAIRYDFVKIYSQSNKGQGAARNYGLSIATGKYIFFIDSDDYVPKENFLSNILNIACTNNVDILEFEMLVYSSDGTSFVTQKKLLENKLYTGEQILLGGFNPGSSCDKLFSNSFLKKHNFFFETSIVHEDVDFLYRVYALAQNIVYKHTCGYVYCYNPNSTDRSDDYKKVKRGIDSDFYIAYSLCCLSRGPYSLRLRNYYKRRSNSLLCSLLFSFLTTKRDFTISDIKDYLFYCQKKSLYPVKGWTMSKKTNCIIFFLNFKSLYLFVNILSRMFLFFKSKL